MNYCRITLEPLHNQQELSLGYSKKGLASLAGNHNIASQLPFTREQFVHELPIKQKGMSISGFQPKLQLVISDGYFNVVDSQGDFILKPSPDEFSLLAENEHATMQVMSRLGFDVPPNGLLAFKTQSTNDKPEYAFIIKRFDRDQQGNAIHQEQLDAAMNIGEKYGKVKNDGEGYVSYEQLADFIIKNINDNILVKQDIFRRIIYAYLLGNNDMHLRNFGLIHPKSGQSFLAPVYDFVSVAPYPDYFYSDYLALPLLRQEEGGHTLAPGFDSKYGEYTGSDFKLLGVSLGISERLIDNILLRQLEKEKTIVEQTYLTSFMLPKDREAVLSCYRSRLSRLQYYIADE